MPRLEPKKESRAFSALVIASGVILPLSGVMTALYGCFMVIVGGFTGLYWIAAGAGLIIADMIIDTIWPRSKDAAQDIDGD